MVMLYVGDGWMADKVWLNMMDVTGICMGVASDFTAVELYRLAEDGSFEIQIDEVPTDVHEGAVLVQNLRYIGPNCAYSRVLETP